MNSTDLNSPSKVQDIIRSTVPDLFWQDLLRCLCENYKASFSQCMANFPAAGAPKQLSPQGRDLLGHHRRAIVETEIKAIGTKHGAEVREPRNEGNTSSYVALKFGVVLITVSHVERPGQLPQKACFRENLARDNQLALALPGMPDSEATAEHLHVLVIYGDNEKLHQLGFAHFSVPVEGNKPLYMSPDLMRTYPDIAAKFETKEIVPAEEVEERELVKPREPRHRNTASGDQDAG